jgi:lipoyl(octanoyl) transferase
MKLTVYPLGLIEYPAAEELQNWLAQEVAAARHDPSLLMLEHPHIYTFGRQGKQENLLWSVDELDQKGISLHWTDRGGDITYHGPGQLVGYPILPLAALDTLGYLRKLEEVLIQTLAKTGLQAGRVKGQTGVWVLNERSALPPAKIASIGVRVDANRITRHGFALNVSPDMSYWNGMIACGLENQAKTSMAVLLADPPTIEQIIPLVIESFCDVFSYEAELKALPDLPGLTTGE